jgi:hypothetical protein
MLNTFYITAKGYDEAVRISKYNEFNKHNLHHNLITFIASSFDTGITSEYYKQEFPEVDIINVRDMLAQLESEKYITHWKSGLCKRSINYFKAIE